MVCNLNLIFKKYVRFEVDRQWRRISKFLKIIYNVEHGSSDYYINDSILALEVLDVTPLPRCTTFYGFTVFFDLCPKISGKVFWTVYRKNDIFQGVKAKSRLQRGRIAR